MITGKGLGNDHWGGSDDNVIMHGKRQFVILMYNRGSKFSHFFVPEK